MNRYANFFAAAIPIRATILLTVTDVPTRAVQNHDQEETHMEIGVSPLLGRLPPAQAPTTIRLNSR